MIEYLYISALILFAGSLHCVMEERKQHRRREKRKAGYTTVRYIDFKF